MTGQAPSLSLRREKLQKLGQLIDAKEAELMSALQSDLRKPELEAALSEFLVVRAELKMALRNLKKWNAPQRVRSSFLNFPSSDYIYRQAYGRVLVISPWNYPFQLALAPVIGAVAMGNRVVLKPSELAPATAAFIQNLLQDVFPADWVSVELGDAQCATALLSQRWDYIFFTGSTTVGLAVAQAAARHLTPYTLELGGKNPCILLADADIELAAKRIAWGKLLNAGQTCIAPDYVLLPKAQLEAFVLAYKRVVTTFYGTNPKESSSYARIINDRHFTRLQAMLTKEQLLMGGESDASTRYIAPTLLHVQTLQHPSMQEEIFGPVLPIITYDSVEETDAIICTFEKPLALYVFSQSAAKADAIIQRFAFGGGCVNDVLVQFVNHRLPFGGIGHSGNGAYHGNFTRDTFSHQKAIVKRATWLDIPLRYPPYKDKWNQLKSIIKPLF